MPNTAQYKAGYSAGYRAGQKRKAACHAGVLHGTKRGVRCIQKGGQAAKKAKPSSLHGVCYMARAGKDGRCVRTQRSRTIIGATPGWAKMSRYVSRK